MLKKAVQRALAKRFSRKWDPATGRITQHPFNREDLMDNCGETARITADTIGGDIRIYRITSREPIIRFDGRQISSGYAEANHSYVVKGCGVWDPVLGIYGNITVEKYLRRLS